MFDKIKETINSFKNIKYKIPRFDYDEFSDVMYIRFGNAKKCKSWEPKSGIVFFYTPENNELNGITIIDYNKRTNKE